MFFTRIGLVIAHFMFWLSAARLILCLFIAFSPMDLETKEAAVSRYIGSGGMKTMGNRIDRAAAGLALGVALGVLCEISKRRVKPDQTGPDMKNA